MNHPLLKKWLPHAIAVLLFLIVSALFCKPALEGNVMNQHDNVGWKGMAQNAFEYKEKNGHFPLWNPNLFSGMPNYQVAMEGKTILPDTVKIFSLGLPKPMNFFFLACLCFYILALVLGVKPVVGMLGALAYSFSTYNPVIVAAGHDTQMLATAFMPLLMAGLLSIYHKKYWLGIALTTFGTYQQISVNHLQVSYYFFLIAALVTLGYLVKWIKEKDWKHIGVAGTLTIVSALIGVAGNALVLKTTSEYSQFTMRGGKDIAIEGDSVKAAKTSGLDTSYAFEYSLGKAEAVTFIMPNAFGGSSSSMSGEGSAVISKLTSRGIPETDAWQVTQNMPRYWGQLYTSGPAYLGVIICLFGLIGFVLVKSPLRWSLLAATLFGIFMAWGKYFAGFNTFLFEQLPLYNKFRSPAFAQVIPQFAVGIMAVLTLQQLFFADRSRELLNAQFRKILYAVGGLFALLAMLYIALDYTSPFDAQIIAGYTDKSGSDEMGRLIVSGLKEDRKSLFGGQLLRALGLALLTLGILWLYAKNKINALTGAAVLLVVSTLEIAVVSKTYFNDDLFVTPDEYANTNFAAGPIDQEILKDKDPNFRVLNMTGTSSGSTFSESKTSYFHKSAGGYHPAKLRIYQDIIEKYLSGRPHPGVINMLNTKYIVVADPQNGQPGLIRNPDAFGPCWLVGHVKLVNNRVEAIHALGNTNLKDTAIVLRDDAKGLVQPQRDSLSAIKMTKFDNDTVEYEFNANSPQFAVFSEIYYPKGWNAYVDGKQSPYINTNYILRGISLPAGKHSIRFVFEPVSVKQGRSIMFIASILITLIFLGGLFMAWRESKKTSGTPA
ncbi:MAG: YfhO family protein [Sphingobacteriales bacterium]|nr:YfhO family protein [Sphingobacteriales bacterium]